MMSNVPEGWEKPEEAATGLYLYLKKKGDSAVVRIIGRPHFFKDKDVKGNDRKMAAFKVLRYLQNEDGSISKLAQVYKASPMVYGILYDYVTDPEWGNLEGYNVRITRTEEQGKYYTVKPMKPSALTDEDRAIVDAANLDLVKACQPRQEQPAQTNDADPFADE